VYRFVDNDITGLRCNTVCRNGIATVLISIPF